MTRVRIEVRSQAEFDACVKAGNIAVVIGNSHVVARENSHVEAMGNSRVEAMGNSRVAAMGNSHVEAWDNVSVAAWDNVSVEAWENSHVEAMGNSHVEARGNSHVVARGNGHVEAWGNVFVRLLCGASIKVRASFGVVIMRHSGSNAEIEGTAAVVEAKTPTTAKEWCEYHGVEVSDDGVATLYKGVHDDYRSDRGFDYSVGSVPVAADWDGGERECGGGLHFSPTPRMTHQFTSGRRYLACPVALADMRAPKADDAYPEKIKAKGCCAPVVECDKNGAPLHE